ncbi:MAG TPA: MFS transporter [Candidatus Limnocylindrales bacterium]|nr:MFS transporter [Candidatus Limnocylindrales bacterium]
MRRLFRGKLWRHADFLKLWSGETVSEFGSQVTVLALPTVAILILKATPFQIGLLGAFEFLAFPVLGLVAGVYADRLRRRPIMIICDIGRAIALGSIPFTAVLGVLSIYQLYLVAIFAGIFRVFFDVSYQSYLPALIDRADLIEGNSKLQVSESAAQIGGPPIAGFLIQLIGGAKAIAVDAASFLVSAIAIWALRKPEPPPNPATDAGVSGFLPEMREGIQVVFGNRYLWRIAGCTATSNLGSNMVFAVFLIFAYRILDLKPGQVGLIFGVGAIGFLVGALIASTAAARLGLGVTLAVAIGIGAVANLAIPLALYGPPVMVLTVLTFVAFLTQPVYNINQVSLRQAMTPDRVQGRMNATMRTIVWGTIPIGSFLGGTLGSTVGIVQTILIGGAVGTLAILWVVLGPVVRLREQPAMAES